MNADRLNEIRTRIATGRYPASLAAELLDEIERLSTALMEIRNECGLVCAGYELCVHAACLSSYSAWAIADAALLEATDR